MAERILFALRALGGAALVAILVLITDHALGLGHWGGIFGAGVGAGFFLGCEFKDWKHGVRS